MTLGDIERRGQVSIISPYSGGASVDELSFCTQSFHSRFSCLTWNYKLIGKITRHCGMPPTRRTTQSKQQKGNPERQDDGEQKRKRQKKRWWVFLSRWGKMLYTRNRNRIVIKRNTHIVNFVSCDCILWLYIYFWKGCPYVLEIHTKYIHTICISMYSWNMMLEVCFEVIQKSRVKE